MLFAMIRGDGLDAKTGLPWADASLDAHALPKRGPNCAGERSRKTAPPLSRALLVLRAHGAFAFLQEEPPLPSVAPSRSSELLGCARLPAEAAFRRPTAPL